MTAKDAFGLAIRICGLFLMLIAVTALLRHGMWLVSEMHSNRGYSLRGLIEAAFNLGLGLILVFGAGWMSDLVYWRDKTST